MEHTVWYNVADVPKMVLWSQLSSIYFDIPASSNFLCCTITINLGPSSDSAAGSFGLG